MTLRWGRMVATMIVAPLFVTGAWADSTAVARAEIQAALERWTVAFNAGDVPGACGLFAPDLVAVYPGVPDRDYSAMCRQLAAAINDRARPPRYGFELEEIIVSGDLAVVRLIWTLRAGGSGEAGARPVRERGVDVFRRQPDGAWKVTRSTAYPIDGEASR
jgi:steroid delta-isomerase